MSKTNRVHMPPPAVVKAARRGIELRKKHGRGGIGPGQVMAEKLISGNGLPIMHVKRVHSYHARHAVDKEGKDWNNQENPSNGKIAYLLWGGAAGKAWADKICRKSEQETSATTEEILYYRQTDGSYRRGGNGLTEGLHREQLPEQASISDAPVYHPQLPPLFYDYDYQTLGGENQWHSPTAFLNKARRLLQPNEESSRENIEMLKEHMRAGHPLDPAALHFYQNQVFRHDGRHRAIAALELGISSIPIVMVNRSGGVIPEIGSIKQQRGKREADHWRRTLSATDKARIEQTPAVAPLYISRPVLNKEDFLAWAASQELTIAEPEELRTTIIYSKEPVNWGLMRSTPQPQSIVHQVGARQIEQFNGGAVVLTFFCPALSYRNAELRMMGASTDFPVYRAHITICYDPEKKLRVEKIAPYSGEIRLGAEIFERIKTDQEIEALKKSREVAAEERAAVGSALVEFARKLELAKKNWSKPVTNTKHPATFPEPGIFTRSAKEIFNHMKSKRVSPKGLGSAIRMLVFYLNRAGKSITPSQKKNIDAAMKMLQEENKKQKDKSQK